MRLVVALLSVVALAFAASAAADAPEEFGILDVFPDVNPCTGEAMTVTFVGTGFIHVHGDRVVVRSERTITTSDGFAGHGTDSFVDNGQICKNQQTPFLPTTAPGERFGAKGLFALDVSPGRAKIEGFELTGLG